MVYYRKYRPQTIDDLDNAHVRETLSSVLKNSEAHAFLFTGPKGLGKTSAARIIAKVVNCERVARVPQVPRVARAKKARDTSDTLDTRDAPGGIEPCNQCDQCVSITNGTNLDVLEIDAASNRGIDEIRDLKEKIRLSPVAAKMKVYIIDEVHMLTTEAFNALLKTLEEPPSHAMFILCTTEPHKVPATIISRCMHINFSLATDDEIVRSLKRIVIGEKLNIDDEVLYAIAKMADGGFRDATKILEEIVSLADGKKITKEVVEHKYQVSSILYLVSSLLNALLKKDAKSGFEVISEAAKKGIEIKYFISNMIENLHGMLLTQMSIQDTKYQIQNTKFSTNEIRELFELLSKAYQDTKYAVVPQLPLELAIIEYCQKKGTEEAKETDGTKETPLRQGFAGQAKVVESSGVTVSSLRKQVGTMKKVQALYGSAKQTSDEQNIKPTIKTSTVELMHAAPNGDVTEEWLDHFWKQLISEIKSYNHTIAGVLRGCSIKSYDKKTLVIQTGYKFHKERLDQVKTLEALADACKLLTGKVTEVKVELKQ